MVWPAQSPDLNPIENLWAILKMKVAKYQSKTIDQLKSNLRKVWEEEINDQVLINLSKSLPKRINLVKKNKGHAIKYQHNLTLNAKIYNFTQLENI